MRILCKLVLLQIYIFVTEFIVQPTFIFTAYSTEVAPLLDANNPAIAKAISIDFDYDDYDGCDHDVNGNSGNEVDVHSDGNEDSTVQQLIFLS